MPHCAALEESRCENLSGSAMKGMRARMVQEGAKRRKFTSMGEDWRQWVDHHDETDWVVR